MSVTCVYVMFSSVMRSKKEAKKVLRNGVNSRMMREKRREEKKPSSTKPR